MTAVLNDLPKHPPSSIGKELLLCSLLVTKDHGPKPFIVNCEYTTVNLNTTKRTYYK